MLSRPNPRVLWIGILLASLGHAAYAAAPTLSFCKPPFVAPLIIKDLLAWVSDSGDQVVAVNLLDANDSNRYYGEIQTGSSGKAAPKHPYVFTRVESGEGDAKSTEMIGYTYVGTTQSGVHVLITGESGGGTLVSVSLLFVTVEEDFGLSALTAAKSGPLRLDRRRLLLRKLGEVSLGDRWDGTLRVEGNKIVIGPNQGFFSEHKGSPGAAGNAKEVVLQLEDSATRRNLLPACP